MGHGSLRGRRVGARTPGNRATAASSTDYAFDRERRPRWTPRCKATSASPPEHDRPVGAVNRSTIVVYQIAGYVRRRERAAPARSVPGILSGPVARPQLVYP